MKIAIVDDLPIYRDLFRQFLANLGHHPRVFADLEEFFSVLAADPRQFDLVITDRYLGACDVLECGLARACRYYLYQGRLILCTVMSSSERARFNPQDFGFDCLIDKVDPNWRVVL